MAKSIARLAVASLASAAMLGAALLAAGTARAADKIRFGLNWVPEGEHCGFFQAKAAGLYDQAGLDVELKPGGPDQNVPLLVGTNQLDLGMGSSFTTLNMIDQGLPGITVASFFQKDPQTLIAHSGQGITTLADVKGRPVMIAKFSQQEFWQFLKQKFGFSDDQLRPYTYSAAPFLADPTAIQQGYVTEDGMVVGSVMKTDKPVILLLADYGYSNYATTVFGMKPWIDAHADAVKKFLDATAAGYKQCISGAAAAGIALLHKFNPDESDALTAYKLNEMKTRGMVDGGDAATGGIGAMTDARWKDFFDTMSASGVYGKALDYKSAYTLRFLPLKD